MWHIESQRGNAVRHYEAETASGRQFSSHHIRKVTHFRKNKMFCLVAVLCCGRSPVNLWEERQTKSLSEWEWNRFELRAVCEVESASSRTHSSRSQLACIFTWSSFGLSTASVGKSKVANVMQHMAFADENVNISILENRVSIWTRFWVCVCMCLL